MMKKQLTQRAAGLFMACAGIFLIAACKQKAPEENGIWAFKPTGALTDSVSAIERDRVLSRAEGFLNEPAITVTASSCPRSEGGKHDYYSEGTYWWPDPSNPDGPYIRRDGLNNPENFNDHGRALIRFSWMVGTQTSAYLLTGEKKYAESALKHLKAWFVDSSTMMNPHLLYAQAIKGVCSGRGIGIIDAVSLIEVARSAQLLERSPCVPGTDMYYIREWFRQFLNWLTTHPYGIEEMNWKNNHGTWWHAQAAAYAELIGDSDILETCRQRFREILLPNQMAADGSFPFETERTKPYAYSLFNLDGMAAVAWILSGSEENLWEYSLPDGRGLKKAVEFMIPFIKDKESWPFQRDVLHWEEQPGLQPFILFASLAYNRPDYFGIWRSLDADYPSDESRRNLPLKNVLLWTGLPDPLADNTYMNPVIPGFNPDPSICRAGTHRFYSIC